MSVVLGNGKETFAGSTIPCFERPSICIVDGVPHASIGRKKNIVLFNENILTFYSRSYYKILICFLNKEMLHYDDNVRSFNCKYSSNFLTFPWKFLSCVWRPGRGGGGEWGQSGVGMAGAHHHGHHHQHGSYLKAASSATCSEDQVLPK